MRPEHSINSSVLVNAIRAEVVERRAEGCAVAVSGGVDSSAVAALAVAAVGPDRVRAVHLPDRDSDPVSQELVVELGRTLGITLDVSDITPMLDACGCFAARDAVVRSYVPGYDAAEGWQFKLVLRGKLTERRLPINTLVVVDPERRETTFRLRSRDYRRIVGETNLKQRVRMMLTYRLAETRNLIVLGTSNKVEVEQGFFVDHGDGTGHLLPLRDLYKAEVFELARGLGVPASILVRTPTTDTFSAAQDQSEFFFGLPYEQIDVAWASFVGGEVPGVVASALGLSIEEIEAVFTHFQRRQRSARRLGADVLRLSV